MNERETVVYRNACCVSVARVDDEAGRTARREEREEGGGGDEGAGVGEGFEEVDCEGFTGRSRCEQSGVL